MSGSRSVIVLGMHRSGTSLAVRGLKAIGVDIGERFIATRFDNPTGYWEDAGFNELNERLLAALGTAWDRPDVPGEAAWASAEVEALKDEASHYVASEWLARPLWGFKDPRTIRVLPFWRSVFAAVGCDDAYVLAIRNPMGVAASLFQRQSTEPLTAHRLWLAYMCPYLDAIAERAFVVVDYDCLMDAPDAELRRIAERLDLPFSAATEADLQDFATNFVAQDLRHSRYGPGDFATLSGGVGVLTRHAYAVLRRHAASEGTEGELWSEWRRIRPRALAALEQAARP